MPDPVEPTWPRESLAIRVGFLTAGLIDSGQGRPFFYLDTGLRYKTSDVYFDLKLPALIAGFDWLSHKAQEEIGVNEPFNLFEAANDPIQYAAFLEPLLIRIGQTFVTAFPERSPFRVTAGVTASVEFLFFELALANMNPENFPGIDDEAANDPFIVAPGGFVAIGGDLPLTAWDLAIGVAPDVFSNPEYVQNEGIVIYADLEVQIDPLREVGAYFRLRGSTYTHTEPIVWTMIGSYGVALHLL